MTGREHGGIVRHVVIRDEVTVRASGQSRIYHTYIIRYPGMETVSIGVWKMGLTH